MQEEIQGPSLHKLFHHDIYKHKRSPSWHRLSAGTTLSLIPYENSLVAGTQLGRMQTPLGGDKGQSGSALTGLVPAWPRGYIYAQGSQLGLLTPTFQGPELERSKCSRNEENK